MKKPTFVIILLLIILSTAFAGSIDVDLLADDEALVFIGSVDEFIITYEEKNYPNTEYSLSIIPTEKIKGDIIIGKSMHFENVGTGKIKLQKGTNYLFGQLTDKLYIWEFEEYNDLFDWEIDKYTENSIILKERHNDSISDGMQKLLNDNSFVLAEQKRHSKSIQADTVTLKHLPFTNLIIIFSFICLIIIIIYRRKNNV